MTVCLYVYFVCVCVCVYVCVCFVCVCVCVCVCVYSTSVSTTSVSVYIDVLIGLRLLCVVKFYMIGLFILRTYNIQYYTTTIIVIHIMHCCYAVAYPIRNVMQ